MMKINNFNHIKSAIESGLTITNSRIIISQKIDSKFINFICFYSSTKFIHNLNLNLYIWSKNISHKPYRTLLNFRSTENFIWTDWSVDNLFSDIFWNKDCEKISLSAKSVFLCNIIFNNYISVEWQSFVHII